MTKLMRRRRAQLMSKKKPEWTELSPSWTYRRVINTVGAISNNSNGAVTDSYQIPKATVKRTGPAKDETNTTLYLFLHEYNASTWLKRTELPNPGDTVTVSANCTEWRLAYLYPQATGKEMTGDVIRSYFGAAYKEE